MVHLLHRLYGVDAPGFVQSNFPPIHVLFFLPLSPITLPPIAPYPPLPRKVNNKLSYRKQNAISIIKHTNAIPSANIILFFYASGQSRLAGGIMFSTCPSVLPSVRPSVTTCDLFWKRMNRFQCKLAQVVPETRHERLTRGSGDQMALYGTKNRHICWSRILNSLHISPLKAQKTCPDRSSTIEQNFTRSATEILSVPGQRIKWKIFKNATYLPLWGAPRVYRPAIHFRKLPWSLY